MAQAPRILLVDDNPDDRVLLRRMLSREFPLLRLDEAGGPNAYTRAVERGGFDLVITDYQLSWTNGLEILADIRARHPELPVIMFTATGTEETAAIGIRAGLDDYVVKSPEHMVRLPAAVQMALQRSEERRERKRAEEALRTREEQFRSLIERSSDLLAILGGDGTFRYVGPSSERILGYRREEMAGSSIFEFLHPEDEPAAREQLAYVLQHPGLSHTAELRLCRKDRSWRVLEAIGRSLSGESGDASVIVNARDITDRKSAERELFTRARQQAAVAEIGQLALAGTDLTPLVQDLTARVARTLEVEFAEVLELLPDGWTLRMAAGTGWPPGVVGTHAAEGGPTTYAGQALLSRRPVIVEDFARDSRFAAPPLLRDHGVTSGMSVVVLGPAGRYGLLGAYTSRRRRFSRDEISFLQAVANVLAIAIRRKHAEEMLRQSEEQLRQAQKMEAVGRLAGGVAHDFNNLLTAICGYGQLLQAKLDDRDARRPYVEELLKAGERAAALTRQLLAFSRKQVLESKILDLNDVVADMDKMLRRLIGEDIELFTLLGGSIGRVKADPGQIQQILMNLAVNARDAMPRGGKLTIETRNVDLGVTYNRDHPDLPPGSYVMLGVSDTGCGMDPETRTHLFEPFFTTKEPGKGTGLGLSTVYGIVKQSGGYVAVASVPEQGTTFRIYLPRAEEASDSRSSSSVRSRVPRGTETVLLVEDSDVVRRLVREVLEANGYTVLEARNGGEALWLCEQRRSEVHLMLTDVVMPVMGGVELAGRAAAFIPGLRVLFMSGYAEDTVNGNGGLEPGAPFLPKPFTPGGLAHKVREVLDAQPGIDAPIAALP